MKALPLNIFVVLLFLISCGKGGPIKGKDLRGTDAVEFLAGSGKKTWQLKSGHDYYEYLQFDDKNEVFFQLGVPIKYEVKGDKLILKDFVRENLTFFLLRG